jgi:hypothetical protein
MYVVDLARCRVKSRDVAEIRTRDSCSGGTKVASLGRMSVIEGWEEEGTGLEVEWMEGKGSGRWGYVCAVWRRPSQNFNDSTVSMWGPNGTLFNTRNFKYLISMYVSLWFTDSRLSSHIVPGMRCIPSLSSQFNQTSESHVPHPQVWHSIVCPTPQTNQYCGQPIQHAAAFSGPAYPRALAGSRQCTFIIAFRKLIMRPCIDKQSKPPQFACYVSSQILVTHLMPSHTRWVTSPYEPATQCALKPPLPVLLTPQKSQSEALNSIPTT